MRKYIEQDPKEIAKIYRLKIKRSPVVEEIKHYQKTGRFKKMDFADRYENPPRLHSSNYGVIATLILKCSEEELMRGIGLNITESDWLHWEKQKHYI